MGDTPSPPPRQQQPDWRIDHKPQPERISEDGTFSFGKLFGIICGILGVLVLLDYIGIF